MNTIFTESRTRTYRNQERWQSCRNDNRNDNRNGNRFDDQFESELPPEIRAEFGGISPRSKNRRPIRPAVPTPPPVSPAREAAVPPIAKPVQRESRRSGSWIWWLLATIGALLMLARFSDNKQPIASKLPTPVEIQRTPLPSVEVRRAFCSLRRSEYRLAIDPDAGRQRYPGPLPG